MGRNLVNKNVNYEIVRLTTNSDIQRETSWNPVKNLLVLCFAFLVLFVSYFGSVNLLSTLNLEDGLGMASQSVLFATYMVSSMVLPPTLIRRFGLKITIVLSMMLFSPYIAANFYPTWYTFIPSAFLLGVAGGPLWSATLPFVNRLAEKQARDKLMSRETCVFVFVGVFYTFYSSCNIWGNLISYLILRSPSERSRNGTKNYTELCGSNFCDSFAEADMEILDPPAPWRVTTLTCVFTFLAVSAIFIIAFLLEPIPYGEEEHEEQSLWQLVAEPAKRLCIPYHVLLIPITIYSGLEMSFMTAEFTKAYIACTQGISRIGLILMAFGATSTISAATLGLVSGKVHRSIIFSAAALVSGGSLAVLWLWTPGPEDTAFLFALAAVWGVTDAVWQSQLRGLYGVLFQANHRSAYSLHSFFEGLGFLVAFAYSSKLCLEPKLWVLASTLSLGMVGYITVEWHNYKSSRTPAIVS